jgi:hypothetical protein
MSNGEVFAAGWSLDDVRWSRFDASKVDAELLAVVKAASLVEYNADDYVAYLKRVYRGASAETLATIERWGDEEIQHGLALGRWSEMADPNFDFRDAFTRFRAGYKPAHFMTGEGSVRGSRRGEMVARCVVESGTSSFYSAIRDATDEPVLKEVAGRIAADEFRHYRLFYDMLLKEDSEPDLPIWRKLWVAMTRINESDDDELAFAYYCGNVARERQKELPYRRAEYSRTHHAQCLPLYRRHHVDKMVKMVLKPAGVNPGGTVSSWASAAVWRVMHMRAGARPAHRADVAKAA